MTEKEKQTVDKFEKFILENELSSDFFVSMLKLTIFYANFGSADYHAKEKGCTGQYIRRTYKKEKINGVTIYAEV